MLKQTKLFKLLKCLQAGSVILLFLILSGCSSSVKKVYSPKCQQLMLQYKLAHKLERLGIHVVRLGDTVTLYLPADHYFQRGSNNLFSTGDFPTVIQFLNAYTTEDIQVRGYQHTGTDETRNLALSRDRAQKMADYFVQHGLDTRLISAQGYGCRDIYDTDHIEIYFRQPPPDDVFH